MVELPKSMAITVDLSVVVYAVGLARVAGLAAALMPAWEASRANLEPAFREATRGSSGGRGQSQVRIILAGGELALAVALLTMAALLVQSFRHLESVDTGFHADGLLTFRVDPPFGRYNKAEHTVLFYRRTEEALLALPGVKGVAANHSLPLATNENYGSPAIAVEGQTADEQRRNPFVTPQVVSPGYLRVMGIPVVAGRVFDDSDRPGTPPVTMLSQPLARRLLGNQSPLGRRVRFEGLLAGTEKREDGWFTIVGITGGVRSASIFSSPGPDVYFSNRQQFVGDSFFVVRTDMEVRSFSRSAAEIVRKLDPDQAIFDVQPMQKRVTDTIWQHRIAGRLSAGFGILALLLAVIGTYSVLSHMVSCRVREMGIRLALGATPENVRAMVVAEGMRTAAAGVFAGSLLAACGVLTFRELLYGLEAADIALFAGTALTTLAVALPACYLPALRASRVQPAETLRGS